MDRYFYNFKSQNLTTTKRFINLEKLYFIHFYLEIHQKLNKIFCINISESSFFSVKCDFI